MRLDTARGNLVKKNRTVSNKSLAGPEAPPDAWGCFVDVAASIISIAGQSRAPLDRSGAYHSPRAASECLVKHDGCDPEHRNSAVT